MSKPHRKTQYVDLQASGRIFPSWVLHNFKQYKLPYILRTENEDPCNADVKLELHKYQLFIGAYLGPGSPYNEILLYHGLGSGKTATSINLMNILYNYNHEYNYVILIKASLREDPWMKDLVKWLGRDTNEANTVDVTKLARYKNIHFVHYDSPYADREFMNEIKKIDTSKPILYVIDEAHNFIRNVYSNINSKTGKRAQIIYDYIVRDKRDNKNTKIVLITATPGVNVPFEFALLFNLLRPGIFPASESEFDRLFVTRSNYPVLNPTKRNIFQRRITGLVSYYIGATPDLYARQNLHYVNLPMSQYQYNIYRVFERLEEEIRKKARRYRRQSKLYRTYTRQASNFVFPYVNTRVNGELRPRPSRYKISERMAAELEKGKLLELQNEREKELLNTYMKSLEYYLVETEKFFQDLNQKDIKDGARTIQDDIADFVEGFTSKYNKTFLNFFRKNQPKSQLLQTMYDCSPKMTAIVFMSHASPGKVMVYTNYVVMEGIDVLKIYYRVTGFNDYTISKENLGYCEYHGRISREDRNKIKTMYNSSNNIHGEKCKVIMISPSATEGIQLLNIRQEHIMEPYWTEVRIQQVIGRGVRQCSHKELPVFERVVDIYRYKVTKFDLELEPDDSARISTDEHIEDEAKAKANLIESFLTAMKESAVDCELYKSVNMMSQSYQCFKFPEKNIIGTNPGPAYKEDLKDDIKYDSGLHAKNSRIERIKVIKINAVYQTGTKKPTDSGGTPEIIYSSPDKYWYYPKSGVVYDFTTHYPVGRVSTVNNLPEKLDKDTYIMSTVVDIPTISRNSVNL